MICRKVKSLYLLRQITQYKVCLNATVWSLENGYVTTFKCFSTVTPNDQRNFKRHAKAAIVHVR